MPRAMESSPSDAARRVPFRRGSTPNFSPQRSSLDLPPLLNLAASYQDYPESPTRNASRRLLASHKEETLYSLNDDDESEKKLKGGKREWSVRRVVIYLLLLGCVGMAAKRVFVNNGGIGSLRDGKLHLGNLYRDPEERGPCRFVSPVEAYHRDLKRLRRKVADQYDFDLVHPSTLNHTARSHHHQFSHTGHLLISDAPGSPHPIPLLLSLGEKRWEELLSRQSQSLGEAVREYERRYSRKPPKGFDIWWEKVKEFNLILPDEYDRINLDLAPFFALPKEEMKRRMRMVEEMKETFTLIVKNGRVDVRVSSGTAGS